jgi:hypothetical protein
MGRINVSMWAVPNPESLPFEAVTSRDNGTI